MPDKTRKPRSVPQPAPEGADFWARVFPSKRNTEQHLLVFKLLGEQDDEDAITGFITLNSVFESPVLQEYLGAEEWNDVLKCNIVTFSIPFILTLVDIPPSRSYVNNEGNERESYTFAGNDSIIDCIDLE